jgi:DNA-binding XRE family transcriptional regulator
MDVTGMDLRVERVRARVTVTVLAARIGLSRQAIHATERSAVVPSDRVAIYRAALAVGTDISETSGAA